MRLYGVVYRSIVCIALAAAASFTPPDAGAADSLLAVGEVSTSVVRPDIDIGVLRAAVASEVPSLDLSHARPRPMILSVSLLRMDTESSEQGASTTCVISAALRTKKGGNLFAILEGRAKTGDPRIALQGAVRGALGGIPEALAQ